LEAVNIIKQLQAVRFDWKDTGKADISLIAEEVAKIIPEAVYYNDRGQIEGLRIVPIMAIMIEAIKELSEVKDE